MALTQDHIPVRGPWPVGTYVWFWFDTGAMGPRQCIGKVRQSGPRAALVEWPNGTRNRILYVDSAGPHNIQPCTGVLLEVAVEEWERREKHHATV